MMMPEQYRNPYLRERKFEEGVVYWPYRTTPLVLPGAKVKKDAPLGECYLRHHPNPMVRAPPHSFDVAHPEIAMKQKVVQNPYNTPVGLYSDQNIADTLRGQASAIPRQHHVKFDPNLSEAYKAVQEEEEGRPREVRQATKSGVFSPQHARHTRISVTDKDGDTIQQSNSFRRIMYNVLGESEY